MIPRDFEAEIRSLQARIEQRQRLHQGIADLEWRLKSARLAQLRHEIRADRKSKSHQSVAA